MTPQAKPIKGADGNSLKCQTCRRRVARTVHHIAYRCNGGADEPDNLMYSCVTCHQALHRRENDYQRWGRKGGQRTAVSKKSFGNLKQFQGAIGRQRLAKYLRE